MLLDLGYRVVCPDILGFGRTDAPPVNQASDLARYGFKQAADDIKELARQLGSETIILGGHDWVSPPLSLSLILKRRPGAKRKKIPYSPPATKKKGGAIVYRTALWHPTLISHLFSICTPFWPPTQTFTPLETHVETAMPDWGYQIRLASGEVERRIRSREEIRRFLNAVYGGRAADGAPGFSLTRGPLYEDLAGLDRTPFMGEEMLGLYAAEYERNGMRGTREFFFPSFFSFSLSYSPSIHPYTNPPSPPHSKLVPNPPAELQRRNPVRPLPPSQIHTPPLHKLKKPPRLQKKTIDIPVLFILARADAALPARMAEGMERFVTRLTRREVGGGHWALWEGGGGEVNGILGGWLEGLEGLESRL